MDEPNGNGRIMVAQADIQHLSDRLAEFTSEVRSWMREADQRNIANSLSLASQQTEIAALRRDIEDLKRKSEAWNLINSVGVGVAALVGFVSRSIP